MNAIDKFSAHVIICGFGRHGQQAAKILTANKIDFVVIDTIELPIKNWRETIVQLQMKIMLFGTMRQIADIKHHFNKNI